MPDMKQTLKFIINFSFWILFPVLTFAGNYYVDSRTGNDANPGTRMDGPWKSLDKVNAFNFKPGDIISFRRGSEWAGGLVIISSGKEGTPITFTAYGEGKNPVISNPGDQMGVSIRINGDWIIVEHFFVRDAHLAGIFISEGADHNVIRNNEATHTGMGVSIHGRNNLVTRNYAHDLTMVRNTKGGDDDFGAVGIWLFSSNNEVSYNRMLNCKAPSYDYGSDGGVVEFYGNVDSCYVHHNLGENCDGSFEVGGRRDTLTHNLIAYNIYINNGVAGGFHVGGTFGVYFEDMRIENNVFFDTASSDYAIGLWNGKPESVDIIYRNNILYIPNDKHISNYPVFDHQYNLYYLGGKTDHGFKLGKGENFADPEFVNASLRNFHLKPGSPAIDAGTDLGFKADFDDHKVPAGKAPDLGVFEHR